MRKVLIEFVPGLVGACVAGVLGYFVLHWIKGQSFSAPVIPGAFAGMACGFLSLNHSRIRGILCALIALFAGLISEWMLFSPPFDTNGTFLDYITHAYQLQPLTQIMIGLGTFLGFWWGRETTSPWRNRLSKPLNPE